jgi:hypothetical protein
MLAKLGIINYVHEEELGNEWLNHLQKEFKWL